MSEALRPEPLSYHCTGCGYESKYCDKFPQKWVENNKGYFCPDCKHKKEFKNEPS